MGFLSAAGLLLSAGCAQREPVQEPVEVTQTRTLSPVDAAGDRIRLAGEGEAGDAGAPPGDLYVQVAVKPHEIFQREDSHLFCEVPIGFVTAALGGELEVPTLDSKVVLKIPAGTQSGKLFRLRGKGVKSVRGSQQGDLLCRISVETPVNLTSRQKELLREFDSLSEENNPESKSFFKSVKSFWDGMKS